MSRSVIFLAICASTLSCAVDSLRQAPPPPEPPPSNPPPVENPTISPDCDAGLVTGRICAPDGSEYLAGADVSLTAVDCEGQSLTFHGNTTQHGHFALEGIPPGTQTLRVTATDIQPFTITVDVEAGVVSVVPTDPADCMGSSARVAVARGPYDSVENILDDLGVGYDYYRHPTTGSFGQPPSDDTPPAELLADLDAMMAYDAIFINCGPDNRSFLHPVKICEYSSGEVEPCFDGNDMNVKAYRYDISGPSFDNLRAYVQAGGSVYASDWSWPVAAAVIPDGVDFHGDELRSDNVNVGSTGQNDGQIDSVALIGFLGVDTIAMNFRDSEDRWSVMDAVTEQVEVLIRGDAEVYVNGAAVMRPDTPLMIRYRNDAGGQLIFTSFHIDAQATDDMRAVLAYIVAQL